MELDDEVKRLDEEIGLLSVRSCEESAVVRRLRDAGGGCDREELVAAEAKIKETMRKLKAIQRQRDALVPPGVGSEGSKFRREQVESLLKRRFFVTPAFEIYGGVRGLYDYGPPGCAIKNNVVQMWRQHFVVEENMLELEATCLTPEPVLKASGHVDKFTDLMVKDLVTGDGFRADHLLEDHLRKVVEDRTISGEQREKAAALAERADDLSAEEMDHALKEWTVKAPDTGNDLSNAYPFNLMFATSIGPTGLVPGYLRPETAQGIFVNFKKLLEFVGGKIPFACAQIGLSFRNEISPKSGLLRVREFMQAEIEHFVDPEKKTHPKFQAIRDQTVCLYPRENQLTSRITREVTVGAAVDGGIIDNETLAYFIARTSSFVERLGLKPEHVRFRQHLENEMAHYARDCWDLEVETSYGWIECAGLADRSAYDLSNHSEKSNADLVARETYQTVQRVEVLEVIPNKGVLGKLFKREAQKLIAYLEGMEHDRATELQSSIQNNGGKISIDVPGHGKYEVTADMLKFERNTKSITGRNYYPSVIEPSFGIGRLLYCLFEHVHYSRPEDETREVLKLPASIAPVKCVLLPLSKNAQFESALQNLQTKLGLEGLINRIDDSGVSIGRRYSRSDEIGIPFGITVDFDSLNDDTVTLRERDSTKQVRGPIDLIVQAVRGMVDGTMTWATVCEKLPSFEAGTELESKE
uniref:Glycine--tRNA ligase n=1 Tax=Compsopogon caeruleus TaxID=31354 RepID=A0A7S1TEB7_9RHOD